MEKIEVRALDVDCTFEEQVEKVKEEFTEFLEAVESAYNIIHIIEEAMDLIQSIITLADKHSPNGFKEHWQYQHIPKMEKREWRARIK